MSLDFVFGSFLERHIHLREEWLKAVLKYAARSGNSNDELAALVYEQWRYTDLQASTYPSLESVNAKGSTLDGNYVLQIQSVLDISQSFHHQFNQLTYQEPDNAEFQSGPHDEDDHKENLWQKTKPKRMLMLELSDGQTTLKALEYNPIKKLTILTCPGCKILLRGPVKLRSGTLLLTKQNVHVLGGDVEQLMATNRPVELMSAQLNRPVPQSKRTSLGSGVPSSASVGSTQSAPRTVVPSASGAITAPVRPPQATSSASRTSTTACTASASTQRRESSAYASTLITSMVESREKASPAASTSSIRTSSVGTTQSTTPYVDMTPAQITNLIVEDDEDEEWLTARPVPISAPKSQQMSAQKRPANATHSTTSHCTTTSTTEIIAPKRRSHESTLLPPSLPTQTTVTSSQRPLSLKQPTHIEDQRTMPPPSKAVDRASAALSSKPAFVRPTNAIKVVKQPPPDDDDEIQILDVKPDPSHLLSVPSLTLPTPSLPTPLPSPSIISTSPVAKRSRTSDLLGASTSFADSFNTSSDEDPMVRRFKELGLVMLNHVDRQYHMPLGIGRQKFLVTAIVSEVLEPFRVEDGMWTMKIRLVDETQKPVDCLISHAVLCNLVGMTPEEAIAIKKSSNIEKRREGAERIRLLEEQIRRLDLLFEIELCYRARPVIKRIETLTQRLMASSQTATSMSSQISTV